MIPFKSSSQKRRDPGPRAPVKAAIPEAGRAFEPKGALLVPTQSIEHAGGDLQETRLFIPVKARATRGEIECPGSNAPGNRGQVGEMSWVTNQVQVSRHRSHPEMRAGASR